MAEGVEARFLRPAERGAALAHLGRDAEANLLLLDATARLGSAPAPGELPSEVVAAWRGPELVGMAGLRPAVIFDARVEPEAVESFVPYLNALAVGLVKSSPSAVDQLWGYLAGRRRALVDRLETAYSVRPGELRAAEPQRGAALRRATAGDLEALVLAARESLREEDRPDPFAGDAKGFRRWVRGRVDRARVVEVEGRVVCVGYADVQRTEGWLVQGVYTWPEARRRGFARLGVSQLCREAFEAGADHVQLAVVEGNTAGRRLYEGLGFEAFSELRTILFT